ncbi:MAG: rod shape-determining protein [Candidatus Buchananbacteria bacterium]|nr:rod shape-determining protein [Candidatus Buchananbacteria bacterium]
MFDKFFKKFSKDVGIDLGTSNTLIYLKDRGIVVSEPSIVALNDRTGQILAVGQEAKRMIGKAPAHITITKPLVDGIISDFEVTEKMLKYFIDRTRDKNFSFASRPRVVVGVPLDVTEVEKKAVEDVVLSAGAREVFLVENVISTAVGARLPIQDPSGCMVVDIGGGLTQIAVISLSGVVSWRSLKIAGNKLDQDIMEFARTEFNLLTGEGIAEEIKKKAGQVKEDQKPVELKMQGRDIISGLPKEITASSEQIMQSIQRSVNSIIEAIKTTIEITPPELVADIYRRGLILSGGGSMLAGIDEVIRQATKIPVKVIEDPLTCSVRGIGLILEDDQLLKEVAIPSTQDEQSPR